MTSQVNCILREYEIDNSSMLSNWLGQPSPTMATTMTKRDTHPHGYRTMCVTIVPVLEQCTRLSYGGNSSISQMSIIEGKSVIQHATMRYISIKEAISN